MKWVKLQTFDRYVLWKNTKNGCRECFWPDVDPNKVSFTERGQVKMRKAYHRPFTVTINGKEYQYD
ncbi:hypothetical protein [uncultured Thomasclavelia sp.]|uniref:hypothetical protein n=1 Tax=uncultured Thomasclavelia sp. TaxID=3025759 RepID=UPI0026220231|nr:hypothetical protein [uncultured Thomasclavelia sp.]